MIKERKSSTVGLLVWRSSGGASSGQRASPRSRIFVEVSGRATGYLRTPYLQERVSSLHQESSPIIIFFGTANDYLYRNKISMAAVSTDGLTSPLRRGMMYVHNPSAAWLAVRPNLIHGALSMTTCPRTGYTSLSSTPPKVRAPSPGHTTRASIGIFLAYPGEKTRAPPSMIWLICCTEARVIVPPRARKRVKR